MATKVIDHTNDELISERGLNWRGASFGLRLTIPRIRRRMKITKFNRGNMDIRGHGDDLRWLALRASDHPLLKSAIKWTNDNCEKVSYLSSGIEHIDWKLQADARPVQDPLLVAESKDELLAVLRQFETDLQDVTDLEDLKLLLKSTDPLCYAMERVQAAQTEQPTESVTQRRKRGISNVTDSSLSSMDEHDHQDKRQRQDEAANEPEDVVQKLVEPTPTEPTLTQSIDASKVISDLDYLNNRNEPEISSVEEADKSCITGGGANSTDTVNEASLGEAENQNDGYGASGDGQPIIQEISKATQLIVESMDPQQKENQIETALSSESIKTEVDIGIDDELKELKFRVETLKELLELAYKTEAKTVEEALKSSWKRNLQLLGMKI